MQDAGSVQRSIYLVERYWPGVTTSAVKDAGARVVAALRASPERASVDYLGSALIPDEETVFSLFRASDEAAVAGANRDAGFRYDRIRRVVTDCLDPRLR